MTAALIRVVSLREKHKCPLGGLGVLLGGAAAQPLKVLPIHHLFRQLPELAALSFRPLMELTVRRDHAGARRDRLYSAAHFSN